MLQPLSPCFFDRCFCQRLAGFVFLLDIMQICSFLTLINNYPHKAQLSPWYHAERNVFLCRVQTLTSWAAVRLWMNWSGSDKQLVDLTNNWDWSNTSKGVESIQWVGFSFKNWKMKQYHHTLHHKPHYSTSKQDNNVKPLWNASLDYNLQ